MKMIGNKTIRFPNVSKISKLFLFMTCTTAGWQIGVKLMKSGGGEQTV